MEKTTLAIDGMSCGHCVGAVQKALAGLPGVEVEQVGIGSAVVAYDPAAASPATIARAVTAAGYPAAAEER